MLAFRHLICLPLVVFFVLRPAMAVDTIVVCPTALREALQPWVQYRSDQGHRLRIIPSGTTPHEIRASIRRVAERDTLKAVVLVGDCAGPIAGDAQWTVPAVYVSSKAITRFGGERHIATDNAYGDLDDDQIPDVAVGRLSADSPEQLRRIVHKIIAYETSPDFGSWRRRVNFVAGVGGFGGLIDGVIETTTKMFLTAGIPAPYHTSMTQASWTSPYCPDPRRFSETTIRRLNEGCLFWIYMGHGNPRSLDTLNVPDQQFPILAVDDLHHVASRHAAPIAVFFSCYAGAFDAKDDCLAEELLQCERGPVAVLAGSRVTMPYAMATLGTGLMKACFVRGQETLGEMILSTKQEMASDQPQDSRRKALDSLGRLFAGSAEGLADERRDHLHLFNLLGDPLLRLRHPETIRMEGPRDVQSGGQIEVTAHTPIGGQAVVELVVRRDRLAFDPPRRAVYEQDDDFLSDFDEVYRRANDPRLAERRFAVEAGAVRVPLTVPNGAVGPCHVRMYVRGLRDFAMGSTAVVVRQPQATSAE